MKMFGVLFHSNAKCNDLTGCFGQRRALETETNTPFKTPGDLVDEGRTKKIAFSSSRQGGHSETGDRNMFRCDTTEPPLFRSHSDFHSGHGWNQNHHHYHHHCHHHCHHHRHLHHHHHHHCHP